MPRDDRSQPRGTPKSHPFEPPNKFPVISNKIWYVFMLLETIFSNSALNRITTLSENKFQSLQIRHNRSVSTTSTCNIHLLVSEPKQLRVRSIHIRSRRDFLSIDQHCSALTRLFISFTIHLRSRCHQRRQRPLRQQGKVLEQSQKRQKFQMV